MRILLVASVLALVSLSGCGTGEPTHVVSYVDSAGRSCTVDTHDISQTATCDVAASTAVTCTTGTPVFTIFTNTDPDTHVDYVQNCGGCADAAAHQTSVVMSTCSTLTCSDATDCVNDYNTCVGGRCVEP